jgi:hypothetical protein
MTSTKELTQTGKEIQCLFGVSFQKILTRIWNLRISYPNLDIILHASDVKSCFCKLKHHPDVAGTLSFIVANIHYIPCGLTFGSNSPQLPGKYAAVWPNRWPNDSLMTPPLSKNTSHTSTIPNGVPYWGSRVASPKQKLV